MGLQKVVEIMSASPISWEDATSRAVTKASESMNEIASVYIQDQSANVVNGRVEEYRVTAKITFHIVNHKSTVTNMKTKSKSHAAPKGVKKAAKKAAPKKKAAAKKATKKAAAPKKKAAAPKKKAVAKKATKKAAAPKKKATKKAAKK
jgi:dodecin